MQQPWSEKCEGNLFPTPDVGDVIRILIGVGLALSQTIRPLGEDVEVRVDAGAGLAFLIFHLVAEAVAVGIAPGVNDEVVFAADALAALSFGLDFILHAGDALLIFRVLFLDNDQGRAVGHGGSAVDGVGFAVVVVVAEKCLVEHMGAVFIASSEREGAAAVGAVGIHGGLEQLHLGGGGVLQTASFGVGRGFPHARRQRGENTTQNPHVA